MCGDSDRHARSGGSFLFTPIPAGGLLVYEFIVSNDRNILDLKPNGSPIPMLSIPFISSMIHLQHSSKRSTISILLDWGANAYHGISF